MVTQHSLRSTSCAKCGKVSRKCFVWLMLLIVLPYIGQFFPELRMYHENQVETVKCPRSCSLDGGSVAFCIFDNATSAVARLDFYLSYELLGNDCGGRTSGNGSAFISFRVKQRMSGSTIYCAQSMLHCSSIVNTLIPPLLIIVEGMCISVFDCCGDIGHTTSCYKYTCLYCSYMYVETYNY